MAETEPETETGDYLLTTTQGCRSISGFSKAKRRVDDLLENAAVDNWRLHDLRRTCGTNLARLSIPRLTVSRVLNHAEGGVTDIYDRHSYLPEKQAALERWAQRIKAILKGSGGEKVVQLHART